MGVEILPAEIELVKMGNEVKSAAFSTEVSNLTKVVLTISSSEFGLARTESDALQTSITLDYMDGLGIDQFATIPLVVKYKGVVDDSAIGKTCTITAKDADGNQLAVANVKVTGIILVDGVPQTILQPNATNTGIYTGTNKNSNAFPYKPRAEVDLSATFDANGTALFDYLYSFGLTTPADNNSAGNLKVVRGRYERNQNIIPDAVTPCYIYKPTDAGNGYIHETKTVAAISIPIPVKMRTVPRVKFDAISVRYSDKAVHITDTNNAIIFEYGSNAIRLNIVGTYEVAGVIAVASASNFAFDADIR